jgi:outer membrane protein, multidrug efflux system
MIRALSLCAAVALAACSAPKAADAPQPPELAARFVGGDSQALQSVGTTAWWRAYGDPALDALVKRGLAQNLDVATSRARIAAAEAALRAAGVASQFDGGLSAETVRSGGDAVPTTTIDSASLTGSFVFDLFGKARLTRDQARAERDAAVFDEATTRLAFLASLTGLYMDVRYYQEAIALTHGTIDSRGQTLELVRVQREIGLASALDVARAESDLATARADIPPLQSGFEVSVFAIATLLAEPAEPLLKRLEQGAAQPRPKGDLATGIPVDVLRNRPDVRAAEQRLVAALKSAGVAQADLYPSLQLSGTVSEIGSTSWSFGPSLSLAIFNRGRLAATRDQAVANAKAAEFEWRQSILVAVEDVQSAASAYRSDRREVARLQEAVVAGENLLELSREAYRQGETTLLDLLDAERSTVSARLSLAQAIRSLATSFGQLQVAVGRGSSVMR